MHKHNPSKLLRIAMDLLEEQDKLKKRLDELEYLDRQETKRFQDASNCLHQ